MESRRTAAVVALILGAATVVWMVTTAFAAFPHGLLSAAFLLGAGWATWEAVRRVGYVRIWLFVLSVALVIASAIDLWNHGLVPDLIVLAIGIALTAAAMRRVFTAHIHLPSAPRPRNPVVIWNPKSGGGKALAANLAAEAEQRGIRPIELKPGDDLAALVQTAVAGGADALAAAGGDGTQALIANIAAQHDLPFACIPAGTRNHFALDLGVDRNDVVGALDAFVDGGERRVDLGDVNGRVFVNNVSLGLYAEAVQRKGYREAKIRTILDTAPELVGPTAPTNQLIWRGPHGTTHTTAAVILVSNNTYRLRVGLGAGTRPRIDDGVLGVTVLAGPHERLSKNPFSMPWRQWAAKDFTVDSAGPIPVGVDGEAMILDSPLHFSIRSGVLRVRLAQHHPGISPSAALPDGVVDAVQRLWRIARGEDPATVLAHHQVPIESKPDAA